MEVHRTNNVSFVTFVFFCMVLCTWSGKIQFGAAASRLFHDEQLLLEKFFRHLVNGSLRAPVPPIGGSPCTNIPGGGGGGNGRCPNLNGKHFAGRRVVRAQPPPPFPGRTVIDLRMAFSEKKNNKQDTR